MHNILKYSPKKEELEIKLDDFLSLHRDETLVYLITQIKGYASQFENTEMTDKQKFDEIMYLIGRMEENANLKKTIHQNNK